MVAMDINSSKRGGPYVATKNIMTSFLNEDFEFKEILYENSLGRFIRWKRIKNLKHQIQEIKPDSIIINGLQLSGFHVCIASLLAGVKSRIITIHGSSLEAMGLPWHKRKLLFAIEYLSLLFCTSFYGVSKYASTISATRWFRNKNRGFVYNVPTAIAPVESTFSRAQLGFKQSDVIVSSSGRITKDKGYEHLSKVIKNITDDNLKFIIIGDSNYLDELKTDLAKEIAHGRVILTGFSKDVYKYLNISDIFVLPTLHETLSVSLLEAAAVSLPLISCNVGGVPEVIENNVNGLLVEPGDIEAMQKAIETLAADEQLRHRMGSASLKHLHNVFNSTKSLGRLRDIILSDIGNR